MYQNYFGLVRKPFDLSPNPSVVYGSEMHKEALAVLRYGVVDSKGFLLLTGDVGTGKTTLLQVLVNSIDEKVHLCLISNPKIDRQEFYYFLSRKFSLERYEGNKSKFVLDFADFLRECHDKNERVILIIDEAHVLPVDILEEIRLLSNQEYTPSGVLSIFLVGQPELNERLSHERLLPLRQRISIRFHLTPFSEEDTRRYILFRLKKAGASKLDFFIDDAIRLIHCHTKGVPRLINIVCDRAMLSAFADSNPVIDAKVVKKSIQELHIPGEVHTLPLPEQKRNIGFMRRMLFILSFMFTLIFFFFLAGQAYYIISRSTWPGYETINEIHDLLQTKGEVVWERYLKL